MANIPNRMMTEQDQSLDDSAADAPVAAVNTAQDAQEVPALEVAQPPTWGLELLAEAGGQAASQDSGVRNSPAAAEAGGIHPGAVVDAGRAARASTSAREAAGGARPREPIPSTSRASRSALARVQATGAAGSRVSCRPPRKRAHVRERSVSSACSCCGLDVSSLGSTSDDDDKEVDVVNDRQVSRQRVSNNRRSPHMHAPQANPHLPQPNLNANDNINDRIRGITTFWWNLLTTLFPTDYVSPFKKFTDPGTRLSRHILQCDIVRDPQRGHMIMGAGLYLDNETTACQILFQGHDGNNYMSYAQYVQLFGADHVSINRTAAPLGCFSGRPVRGMVYMRFATDMRLITGVSGQRGLYTGVFWLPIILLDMPVNVRWLEPTIYFTADFLMYPTSYIPSTPQTSDCPIHSIEHVEFSLPMHYLLKRETVWGYRDARGICQLADGHIDGGGIVRRMPRELIVINSDTTILRMLAIHPVERRQ